MKAPGSPPLTYFPAYAGLFAALVLGISCNAYLDIQYRSFGFEVLLWSVFFALTLRRGWLSQGVLTPQGQRGKTIALVIGTIASILIFIPMWGFPRAGLAILAALQTAQNCVLVTRRHLHMGLLVSLIFVLFASSHYRADWTMLFYLIPYLASVVFTLVAEQISRRAQDVRRESLGVGSTRGQWSAILAASTIILATGAVLYAVTPQTSWHALFWKYGQPSLFGQSGEHPGGSPTGGSGEQGLGGGNGDSPNAGEMPGENSGGISPNEMREAARRPGMPQWQSFAINKMADLLEGTTEILKPLRQKLDELHSQAKQWLKENQQAVGLSLLLFLIAALLFAAWRFFRETRPILWLLAHLDYLRLVVMRQQAAGNASATQYYAAMQRLFDLHGLARPETANTREYLARIAREHEHVRHDAEQLTLAFELARYGNDILSSSMREQMRENYRRLFQHIDRIDALSK